MKEYLDKILMFFNELPPDMDAIDTLLDEGKLTGEQITEVLVKIVQDLTFDYKEFFVANECKPEKGKLRTDYLSELLEVFIKHGADIKADARVLEVVAMLPGGTYGADCLRLLLENGANPNAKVGDETVFSILDEEVVLSPLWYYESDWNDDLRKSRISAWLVMAGYGGNIKDGQAPLTMLNGHKVDELKEYEKFDFRYEYLADDWYLHIYDKTTKEDVAIL